MKLFNLLKDPMESKTLESVAQFHFGIKKSTKVSSAGNVPALFVHTHALRMHLLDSLKFQ